MIKAYAAFVHMLPASHANGFNEPGGLLRLGLEVGFFALQGTDARIFSGRSTILVRQEIEPRWRLATFIAGLCSELHLALGALQVICPTGEIWPACLLPLSEWLDQRGARHYAVHWNHDSAQSRGFGLFALSHVVPTSVLQDLAFCNPVIIPHLMASISGLPLDQSRNVLDELVRRSLALVIHRNLLPQSRSLDPSSSHLLIGLHLKRFVLDAMRHLLCFNANWAPNLEKSRVRYGSDGMFLIWPQAAYDVIKLWERDQLDGLPTKPEDLLDALAALNLCDTAPAEEEGIDEDGSHPLAQPELISVKNPSDTKARARLFVIQPPGSKLPWQAIRVQFPDAILTALQPTPTPLSQSMQQRSPQLKPSSPPGNPGIASPKIATQIPPAATLVSEESTSSTVPNHLDRTHPPSALLRRTTGKTQTQPLPVHEGQNSTHSKNAAAEGLVPASPDGGRAQDEASEGAASKHFSDAVLFTAPRFSLQASLRLNPALGELLRTSLNSLQFGGSSFACVAKPEGFFIGLEVFEAHGFPAAIALRSLLDAQMLAIASAEGSATVTMDVGGKPTRGVVVASRFISGWPLAPNPLFELPACSAGG